MIRTLIAGGALVGVALVPYVAHAASVSRPDGFRIAGGISCQRVVHVLDCGTTRMPRMWTLHPRGNVVTFPVPRPNGFNRRLPVVRPGQGVIVGPHYVARVIGRRGSLGPSIRVVSRHTGYGFRMWSRGVVLVPPRTSYPAVRR